jgi:hypothetical protein
MTFDDQWWFVVVAIAVILIGLTSWRWKGRYDRAAVTPEPEAELSPSVEHGIRMATFDGHAAKGFNGHIRDRRAHVSDIRRRVH